VSGEYTALGNANGGRNDIALLDSFFNRIGFRQNKSDTFVTWAVLNSVLILRQHSHAHQEVAKAMTEGRSVGGVVEALENAVAEERIR
jgi:hypothetical protein